VKAFDFYPISTFETAPPARRFQRGFEDAEGIVF